MLFIDMFRDVTSDNLVLFLGGDTSWDPPTWLSLVKLRTELLSSSGKQRVVSCSSLSTFLLLVAVMSTGFTIPSPARENINRMPRTDLT